MSARSEGRLPPTFENVEVPVHFGPVSLHVDEALIKRYAFCQDDYTPWHRDGSGCGAPLVAHAALLANDLQAMYYCKYDRRSVRGLHAEEELWFFQPVLCGETLSLSGSFTEKFEKRGNGYVVAESVAVRGDGTECVRHRAVQIMRLERETTGQGKAGVGGGRIVPGIEEGPRALRATAGLAPGTPLRRMDKRSSQEQVSVYSFVGEYERNIHNDIDVARSCGFDEPIAQGLQIAGHLSQLCNEFFGAGWLTSGYLRTKFLLPVPVGSDIAIGGRVASPLAEDGPEDLRLELWARNESREGELACVGWAKAKVA